MGGAPKTKVSSRQPKRAVVHEAVHPPPPLPTSLPSSTASLLCSGAMFMLIFSCIVVFHEQLETNKGSNLLAGFMGSLLFLFSTIAVGNIGEVFLTPGYQLGLGGVVGCFVVAAVSSMMVNRVSATSWFVLIACYMLCVVAHTARIALQLPCTGVPLFTPCDCCSVLFSTMWLSYLTNVSTLYYGK